ELGRNLVEGGGAVDLVGWRVRSPLPPALAPLGRRGNRHLRLALGRALARGGTGLGWRNVLDVQNPILVRPGMQRRARGRRQRTERKSEEKTDHGQSGT